MRWIYDRRDLKEAQAVMVLGGSMHECCCHSAQGISINAADYPCSTMVIS